MARLVLRDVCKIIKGTVIVDRLSLEIDDGEFLVILGPSGCGKSTTLNMIAGLEEPTQGEIFIKGRRVTHLPPKDRKIAMVFQNYALYPHMSVAGNLGFGLKMAGVAPNDIKRQVQAVATMLGIESLLERRPKDLSGGQRQRVAVGRAMVRDPDLFLFDEPLSNLDAQLRGHMRVELKQLHERMHATTVYVTHDQTEAMTMASRIVVMRSGVIQQIGAPLDIYDRPCNRFVAQFVGSPTMNFMTCQLVREDAERYVAGHGFKLKVPEARHGVLDSAPSGELLLGIRPEDITFGETDEARGAAGTLNAEIIAIEPLGHATYVSLRLDRHLMTAIAPARMRFAVHDIAPLRFNMQRAHLFATDSAGTALR